MILHLEHDHGLQLRTRTRIVPIFPKKAVTKSTKKQQPVLSTAHLSVVFRTRPIRTARTDCRETALTRQPPRSAVLQSGLAVPMGRVWVCRRHELNGAHRGPDLGEPARPDLEAPVRLGGDR